MQRDWNDISTHRYALEEYYSHARAQTQLWHNAVVQYEKEYFLEQPVGEGESKRTDIKDIVDQMSNVLDNAEMRFRFTRPGNSYVDIEKAEALEKYMGQLFDTIDQRKGFKVRSRLIQSMLSKSVGILHWTYVPNPVAGLEDIYEPGSIPPVDLHVVDPMNFMPVLGGPLG